MFFKRILIPLFLGFSTLSVSCQFSAGEAHVPNTFVAEKFINDYLQNVNQEEGSLDYEEWLQTRMDVTVGLNERLKNLIREAEEVDPEMGLEYDPILNSQDYPQTTMRIKSVDQNTGLVILMGEGEASFFEVTVQLKYSGGKWLVSGCGALLEDQD